MQNLKITMVPQDFLEKIEADMKELKELLKAKNEEEIGSQWIESRKIPQILGVSRKTWQIYRDKRLIPFSQIGSKIYVRRLDLETFMEQHYLTTKSQEWKKN